MAFSWKSILAKKKSPDEQVMPPRRGFAISAGVPVTHDTAMEVSAFYRGVIFISSQIAKLPWLVKDADNNVVDDSISILLDLCPNPEMNSMTFRLLAVQLALTLGNFYAEIERNSIGRPIALWPLNPLNVELMRSLKGDLVYRVVGGSAHISGDDAFIPPRDMFHIKNFHTKDGLLGQGIVSYARDTLGISLGADRMAGNLFKNSGLPSGVLEVPGTLSDEAFLRMRESWAENHGGRKSGGVAVLEEGVKFQALMMSPDVMQFLESRKFGVLEIARFLGLPPTKLFDTDAATFNNQENSNLEVATDTLDAWVKNFEMEADIKILSKRYNGRRAEMDIFQLFRGDMTTRANYFEKMMQTASIQPNEIRRAEGRAPYKGGDRYYVATNNFSPADRIDEIVDAQLKAKAPPPAPAAPTTHPSKDTKNTEDEASLIKAAADYLSRK